VTENYGDDLRREMKKLRKELGIRPDGSSRSKKKTRSSRWIARTGNAASAPAPHEPSPVTIEPPTSAFTGTNEELEPAAQTTSAARGANSTVKPKRRSPFALIVVGVLLIVVSTYGFTRFDFVTASQGIDTTFGASANLTVIVDSTKDVAPQDLVAAKLPQVSGDGVDGVLIGTVFSENTETVAVYDGDVIWQIPVGDILGTVMFATATESL
jgi:hypothetical protein